jgi:hypothetical protein
MRAVVNKGKGVIGVAVRAQGRLRNSPTVNLHSHTILADVALEESLSHLRDD